MIRCLVCGLEWGELGIASRHVQRAHPEVWSHLASDALQMAAAIAGVLRRVA